MQITPNATCGGKDWICRNREAGRGLLGAPFACPSLIGGREADVSVSFYWLVGFAP